MEKTNALDPQIIEFIRQTATGDCYAAYLRNTLMELMAIDTTVAVSPSDNARLETECFDWLGREINDLLGQNAVIQRVPISPSSAEQATSADSNNSIAALADGAYCAGRANLRVTIPGTCPDRGPGVIVHAHIDESAPHLPPRSAGERVLGRGACDGKAQLAILLAQIKLLAELEHKLGHKATLNRIYHFAIDGHRGGIGAWAFAAENIDPPTPVLLHQPTSLVPQAGQFGWLSYRCRLTAKNGKVNTALEILPFVLEAIQKEAKRLRDESDHPLFDAARVRGYPLALGHFGSTTERFCPHVAFEIVAHSKANPQRVAMKIIEFLEEAMSGYVDEYGDRTRENDPATGQPRLDRHFDLKIVPDPDAQIFRIDIHGCRASGPLLDDGESAIAKMVYLIGALLRVAVHFPAVQAFGRLLDEPDPRALILQGGQSFTARHGLDEVRQRLSAAAQRGVENCCRTRRQKPDPEMVTMDWEHPRREAFAEPQDSPAIEALRQAFNAIGEPWPKPIAGAFGGEAMSYHAHKHPVAVFGAGRIENIRWDEEYIDIPELQKSLAISTLAAWWLIQ